MTAPASPMFTNEEMQRLILALGYSRRDGKGFTAAELDVVVEWAEETRINHDFLENVLQGSMVVDVKDGAVAFSTSPQGDAEVEAEVEAMVAKAMERQL